MNYVLPFQRSREVATLVHKRARQVVDQVLAAVEKSSRQSLDQSGFLRWTTTEGTVRGLFVEGRCEWLLLVEAEQERVVYYRNRGDCEHFEIHEPAHAGASIVQKVEQIGLVIHSYNCETSCQLKQVDRKIRWWEIQRWLNEMKAQVRGTRAFPNWLNRKAS